MIQVEPVDQPIGLDDMLDAGVPKTSDIEKEVEDPPSAQGSPQPQRRLDEDSSSSVSS